VLGGHGRHARQREGELEVHGLLGPQRAVVVEDGDALGRGHELGVARVCDAADEVDDALPGRTGVPGRQGIA
jgi:hypothetical protein